MNLFTILLATSVVASPSLVSPYDNKAVTIVAPTGFAIDDIKACHGKKPNVICEPGQVDGGHCKTPGKQTCDKTNTNVLLCHKDHKWKKCYECLDAGHCICKEKENKITCFNCC